MITVDSKTNDLINQLLDIAALIELELENDDFPDKGKPDMIREWIGAVKEVHNLRSAPKSAIKEKLAILEMQKYE